VAESRQFGTPKVLQFGDKTAGDKPGDSGHCVQCEAMLADALDGTLSAADQEFFDLHMANCGPCAQSLADARRGIAFLEMLRTPAPEPPEALVERILAQTSRNQTSRNQASWAQMPGTAAQIGPVELPGTASGHGQQGAPALASAYAMGGAAYGNVLPFPRRAVAAMRRSSFGQVMLQPRLAMTAAMAFFSVALTMNLTGFHPTSLRASDLQPSSLKRDFHLANARAVQYYEGLRVVYELESRVHDLQSADDSTGSGQSVPATADQPGSQTPAAQPGDQKTEPQSPASQPGAKQQEHGKPSGNAGTSRREDQRSNHLMLAAETYDGTKFRSTTQARVGRTRA
jgi:predicted anti-sigma-YlaC factor YlaD